MRPTVDQLYGSEPVDNRWPILRVRTGGQQSYGSEPVINPWPILWLKTGGLFVGQPLANTMKCNRWPIRWPILLDVTGEQLVANRRPILWRQTGGQYCEM